MTLWRASLTALGCASILSCTHVAAGPEDEARIHRVERGLLPRTLVAGGPAYSLERRMQHHRVPGVSIAVIEGFAVAWTRAYGLADAETETPVTIETLFEAGEVSRLPSILAVLALEKQARLSMDANLGPILERLDARALGGGVTWRSLLSRGGRWLLGDRGDGFPPWVEPATPQDFLKEALLQQRSGGSRAPALLSVETIVLEHALVDLMKQPFPELMESTLLKPAGMVRSFYEQPLRLDRRPLAAAGHDDGEPIPGKRWVYADVAGRGLWTTPTDLARLAVQFQRGMRGDTNALISQKTAVAWAGDLFDPMEPPGHDAAPGYLHVSGSNQGFLATVIVHLSRGCGAVVMANSSSATRLVGEILRAIAQEYDWPSFLEQPRAAPVLPKERVAALVGRYHLDEVRVAEITSTADGRLIWRDGHSPESLMMLPLSDSRFLILDFNDEIEFTFDSNGEVQGFRSAADRPPQVVWKRIPPDQTLPIELLEAGKIDAALERLRLQKSPENPQWWIDLGQGLFERGRFAAAVAVFRLGAERTADPAQAYEKLAEAALASGDLREAAAAIVKALELLPQDPGQDSSRVDRVLATAAVVLEAIVAPDPAGTRDVEISRGRRTLQELIRTTIEHGLADRQPERHP